MTRQELTDFIFDEYSVEPDYPFRMDDVTCVFRHIDNRKWFGIAMAVPYRTIGMNREGNVDILNVKCDPVMMGSFRGKPGFCPAYHMNKDKWITILLDGSAEKEDITALLAMSYNLTAARIRKRKEQHGGCGMNYRRLGKTNLQVSEIGFGGEWLERHGESEAVALLKYAHSRGINIIDCWMPDPKSRDIIGQAIEEDRTGWYVQGHIGSTYQNGQYTRTRDAEQCRIAFEDLLTRLKTGYIDLGMIHYVDRENDWEAVSRPGPYLDYVRELKAQGKIRHIGLSTHNPVIARKAAESGLVEMILFSVNPAFDLMPPTDEIENYFADRYEEGLNGVDPVRAEMYKICEQQDVGITCMKPFAGGRLFDAKRSPFGVALTPVQCIHYALTKPAVVSVLCGYDTPDQVDAAVAYETAQDSDKDYASVLASAPEHTFAGGECTYCGHCKPCPVDIDIAMVNKLYDLAAMQPEVPESLKQHYLSLEHRAGECVGCRGCESRCPFGVKVAGRMAETAKLFGE